MLTKPVLAGRTASAQQKRTVAADAGRTTSTFPLYRCEASR